MRVRNQGKAIKAQELFYRKAYEQASAEPPAARQDTIEPPAAVPAVPSQKAPAPAAEEKLTPHLGAWLHTAMDKLRKQ